MGILGIRIHNLQDQDGRTVWPGGNPFDNSAVSGTPLSRFVSVYDPPGASSQAVYAHIKANLAQWVEDAVRIRSQ